MIWKKWARLSCTCTGTETKRLGLIKNRQYVSSIRGGWYGHIGFVRQFGRYEERVVVIAAYGTGGMQEGGFHWRARRLNL